MLGLTLGFLAQVFGGQVSGRRGCICVDEGDLFGTQTPGRAQVKMSLGLLLIQVSSGVGSGLETRSESSEKGRT